MSAFDDAWQAALAAEQQAAFGYSLLGPRLGQADQPLALQSGTAHEALRDATGSAMITAGLVPQQPKPDYPALYPVTTAAQARELAITLEDDCAAAWRFVYASAASQASAPPRALIRRREAQTALTASAVRGARWRGIAGVIPTVLPFPGIG